MINLCLLAAGLLFYPVAPTTSPYEHQETFIQEAKDVSHEMPEETMTLLEKFKANELEDGYLYFQGLPVDLDLCNTPQTEYPPQKKTFVSEFILCLFGSHLGEPFNYIQEEGGNLFRNVRPTKVNQYAQTSDGSKVDLELHTETAFHPLKPDYLMLYCLRGDPNGEAFTLVSSLKKIIPQLDQKTLQELRRPQYRTGIDVSFGNKDRTKFCEELIPVLYGVGKDEMVTYDLDLMEGLTPEAIQALEVLKGVILAVQEKVLLQPGDLLILDNKRAIHGRTAYTARFDGKDRWLQRTYISKDAAFIASIPLSGRIIKQEF